MLRRALYGSLAVGLRRPARRCWASARGRACVCGCVCWWLECCWASARGRACVLVGVGVGWLDSRAQRARARARPRALRRGGRARTPKP